MTSRRFTRREFVKSAATGLAAAPLLGGTVAEEVPYVYLWWPYEIRAVSRHLAGVPPIGLRDAFQYANEVAVIP